MKILVLAADYPKPGRLFGGIFNERSVVALKEICDRVEVLVPRPYAPPFTSYVARWKVHALTPSFEARNGVPVYRPAVPVLPRIGSAFWFDHGAFLWCRKMVRRMYRRTQFDAIISFDLSGPGGIAWRIGRDLGIPASGWATGGDVRQRGGTTFHRSVSRTLQRLDLVFYQSHELREKAAEILGIPHMRLSPDRHIVLPRGIPQPPVLARIEIRNRVRRQLRLTDDKVVVLSVGRISREKGVFDLLKAVSLAAEQDPRITCVVVGSSPASDESTVVQNKLHESPGIKERVMLLPACTPDRVWEYLCAADIFAFTSHHEGMPNSLLEAMAMQLPAVAFGIPAVLEIDAGTGSLLIVPPLDANLFGDAILRLTNSPEERARLGKKGKSRIMSRFLTRENMAIALARLTRVVEEQRGSKIPARSAV